MHAETTIGERLKAAREELGYTQTGIADAVGCGFRTWQDYEAGKRRPGSSVIAGLVRLRINANWLLEGSGPMLLKEEQVDDQVVMLRDVSGDQQAAEYRENRRKTLVQRSNAATDAVEAAIAATGYKPPVDVTEILKWLAVRADLDEEDLLIVLRTLQSAYYGTTEETR